jgi:hypothetical protein
MSSIDTIRDRLTAADSVMTALKADVAQTTAAAQRAGYASLPVEVINLLVQQYRPKLDSALHAVAVAIDQANETAQQELLTRQGDQAASQTQRDYYQAVTAFGVTHGRRATRAIGAEIDLKLRQGDAVGAAALAAVVQGRDDAVIVQSAIERGLNAVKTPDVIAAERAVATLELVGQRYGASRHFWVRDVDAILTVSTHGYPEGRPSAAWILGETRTFR